MIYLPLIFNDGMHYKQNLKLSIHKHWPLEKGSTARYQM